MPHLNIEQRSQYYREYYLKNKERLLQNGKEYYHRTIEERRRKAREYQHNQKNKEARRKYRAKNKDREQKNGREYYKKNPRAWREKHWRIKGVNITYDKYKAMSLLQNGVCAICKGNGPRALALDHNHLTGKIRGLLCGDCNRALGWFKDDSNLLVTALRYLEIHDG